MKKERKKAFENRSAAKLKGAATLSFSPTAPRYAISILGLFSRAM